MRVRLLGVMIGLFIVIAPIITVIPNNAMVRYRRDGILLLAIMYCCLL